MFFNMNLCRHLFSIKEHIVWIALFLDAFFKELNVSLDSTTSPFSDVLLATLNETLEKVPDENGEKFSSILFSNLPTANEV